MKSLLEFVTEDIPKRDKNIPKEDTPKRYKGIKRRNLYGKETRGQLK